MKKEVIECNIVNFSRMSSWLWAASELLAGIIPEELKSKFDIEKDKNHIVESFMKPVSPNLFLQDNPVEGMVRIFYSLSYLESTLCELREGLVPIPNPIKDRIEKIRDTCSRILKK
jgi:hypothetical protein